MLLSGSRDCEQVGEQALAYGAWAAGVQVAVGYPGSPSSDVIQHLLSMTTPDEVHVQWVANEKVALETAVGASLAAQRALVCMKSVGLNIALDPLMTVNLTGVAAGLVILVGDDPGAWASQNEQDSRYLSAFAELPLLEPASPAEGAAMMGAAFDLSEQVGLPIVVRETRDFSRQTGPVPVLQRAAPRPPAFATEGLKWVSLPFNVVANHRRLHQRLADVAVRFDRSPFNAVQGETSLSILACGFAHTKLLQSFPQGLPPALSMLKLGTLYPLPETLLVDFLARKAQVLVLEETEPFLEERLRSLAQRHGLNSDIRGKETGDLPREGALAEGQIRAAVARLLGQARPQVTPAEERGALRPSQQSLCEGCFYIPLFEALRDALAEARQEAVVCADPGCAIRIHQPPFEMLHVKHSMGSAIALASGLALAGVARLPIALVGDSSFFHTGINGLLNAVASGSQILVLILDNGSAALTGGQPHPGSGRDARGDQARAVPLERLLCACGADYLATVEPIEDRPATYQVMRDAIQAEGLRVVVAQGACVRDRP